MTLEPEVRRAAEAPDDPSVIARVLKGEKQQFEHLVRRYQQGLYRHALTMVLDQDVAADMVQDTFVRAYVNLRQCRDHARFRAWLFQTLRNRCLDYLKDASRRNLRLDDVAEPLTDDADSPGAVAARNEIRLRIRSALARLSPALREAFVMHYVDGMPYEAMAELLDASVSALKMRTLRAREALSSVLHGADVTGDASASSLASDTMNGFLKHGGRGGTGKRLAIAMMLALSGAAASAQGTAPQERINTSLARARQVGIPVSLLESKLAEGKAKGVSQERIAAAIERRLAALERANQALRGEPDAAASLAVAADAIESGVSEAVLKSVSANLSRDRRNVAIATLTELVHRGQAPEAALGRVKNALKSGPDALTNLPGEAAGRGRGTGPPDGQTQGNARGQGGGAETGTGPPSAVPAPGKPPQSGPPEGRGGGRPSDPGQPGNPGRPDNPGRGNQ